MSSVAIFYESVSIYWSSLIMGVALLTGFVMSLTLCARFDLKSYKQWLYWPSAAMLGAVLAGIIYMYCNPERIENLSQAMSPETYGYSVTGVIISIILFALILRKDAGDIAAPGIAFVLSCARFCNYFTDGCRGKMTVQYNGTDIYFPLYLVSALILMIIALAVLVFMYRMESSMFGKKHVFRLFLMLFSMAEIVIDSARYDSLHLVINGEQFEKINKAAGFMGLSQLTCAVIMIWLFVTYIRKNFSVMPLVLFIIGIAIAAGAEYLVQRYSGMYMLMYSMQSAGVVLMGAGIVVPFYKCVRKK